MEYFVTKNQKRLRCGITTGTCAAVAAKAAASLLLLGRKTQTISLCIPKGVVVEVPVLQSFASEKKAEYGVEKDSGDDPDVTNHAVIYASVERLTDEAKAGQAVFRDARYPLLFLDGGAGVGRVTRDGLEQEKGMAAINAVPREMIFQAVSEICELAEYEGRLLIVVRVPQGEELAGRTFNPRLGIEGGISILGTSGMIEPMSERAIIDTIETEIRQLQREGKRNLLVTPGNYGQGYASRCLKLNLADSVKCSNYIGETIDLAVAYGMENFLLVGNMGKLVKLAAGIMNTHSRAADGRGEIFAVHAVLCGGDAGLVSKLMNCVNTEEMLQLLEEKGLRQRVCESICQKIEEHIAHRVGGQMQFGVIVFSERFGWLGQTENAAAVLKQYQNC
jgi:cobalt-precorrin-5B (C1)-methyltransferase